MRALPYEAVFTIIINEGEISSIVLYDGDGHNVLACSICCDLLCNVSVTEWSSATFVLYCAETNLGQDRMIG